MIECAVGMMCKSASCERTLCLSASIPCSFTTSVVVGSLGGRGNPGTGRKEEHDGDLRWCCCGSLHSRGGIVCPQLKVRRCYSIVLLRVVNWWAHCWVNEVKRLSRGRRYCFRRRLEPLLRPTRFRVTWSTIIVQGVDGIGAKLTEARGRSIN